MTERRSDTSCERKLVSAPLSATFTREMARSTKAEEPFNSPHDTITENAAVYALYTATVRVETN